MIIAVIIFSPVIILFPVPFPFWSPNLLKRLLTAELFTVDKMGLSIEVRVVER
jgi:hypothetical protein